MMDPSIFHAYDVRGKSPAELDEQGAYRIGRAFAEFVKERVSGDAAKTILVQRDARETSPVLTQGVIRGITDSGVQVIDGGLATTPMHYFSMNHADVDGGMMVTASHNPAIYNGFKFSLRGAVPVGEGSGLETIRQIALRNIFRAVPQKGAVSSRDLKDDYVEFLSAACSGVRRKLSVAIDVGNGMVGYVFPDLLKKIPVRASVLYGDVDMRFPNHEANPVKDETLVELVKAIVRDHADFGIAFDGDGDRIRVVDDHGELIANDILLAFIADRMLEHEPNATVIYDVRSSDVVRDVVRARGGNPVEERVGHAFIKARMRLENALLAGEVSGHFYFKDFFYADGALWAFLLTLRFLSEETVSAHDVFARYIRYAGSGEKNFVIERKETFLEEIASLLPETDELYWKDGLSARYADWKLNLRLSNTEPLLRLNMEAKTPGILKEKMAMVISLIAEHGGEPA